MKKQDLRIGIIIFDSVRQKEVTLELKHFKELEIAETNFFERYQPIELNPEWLEKFGFEKNDILTDEWQDHTRFSIFQIPDFDGFLSDWGGSPIGECRYVHQLQNLYFSLTQTELTLKP